MKKIYYNADVVTMDESLPSAQAVVVEDGKIVFVGTNEAALEQKEGAELVDLEGKALLPGFIDPHSHFSGVAFAFLQISLEETSSLAEIKQRIVDYIAANNVPEGAWITATGYDHNALEEKAHPTAAFLDEFVPNNPIMLQHKSGHMGVVNTLGLKGLNITVDTPNPEGGLIGKDENGLTGYLEEAAYIQSAMAKPMPSPQEIFGAFLKAQSKYASYGITTTQEGLLVKELAPLYQGLVYQNMLKLDIVSYADAKNSDAILEMFKGNVKQYGNHFKVGGIKLLLDGSPQGRTAWMKTPYVGDDSYCGYGAMKDEDLDGYFKYAMEKELQVLAHCNGDAAAEQYINAVKKVHETHPIVDDMRTVMIHAQLLQPAQLEELKASMIIPSYFVAHVYHWGDIHVENFGLERASQISCTKSALDKDILFTFHQDSPIIDPNMIETLWIATNRLTKKGVLLGENERISTYEALKAITINGAYQYFEEDSKGSITVNKIADLVVLDRNPLKVETTEIKDIQVLETIKDGNTIYKR